jgi:hypothetical protein
VSVTVGFRSAPAISDRARDGPGAPRPDRETPRSIDGRERPTTRTDRAHFDHGQALRKAIDFALTDHGDPALLKDRDIEARAPHIGGDQVRLGQDFGEPGGRKSAS